MDKKESMETRLKVQPLFVALLRQPVLAPVLMAALLVALAACSPFRDETLYLLGDENVELGDSATLVCSEQCRDSSQCGTIDTDWVILAKSDGPATEAHDLTFPDRSPATIVGQQMVTLQYVGEPAKQQSLRFYAVEVADGGAGWVAGWCIGQQIVP